MNYSISLLTVSSYCASKAFKPLPAPLTDRFTRSGWIFSSLLLGARFFSVFVRPSKHSAYFPATTTLPYFISFPWSVSTLSVYIHLSTCEQEKKPSPFLSTVCYHLNYAGKLTSARRLFRAGQQWPPMAKDHSQIIKFSCTVRITVALLGMLQRSCKTDGGMVCGMCLPLALKVS